MKRLSAVLITLSLSCGFLFAQSAPIVKTTAGSVSGSVDPSKHVEIFKGIPFAAPPVGDFRWREPQPVKPWTGVRDAREFGPSCMQPVHTTDFLPWTLEYLVRNGVSEDCLYLNIWTPQATAKKNAPVLVYIPGGGFTEGSGEVPIYDGTNLAAKGLIVVTVNYRLGIFGFFAHPELTAESPHHASGNYGLLDQVAALQWVQKNIAAFGGDPHRVTLWGQSAGAFSVGALLVSPRAKGLFQRAMASSGLSIAGLPMKFLHAAEQDGTKFAADHHAKTLKDLRAIPANDLLKAPRTGPILDGWLLTPATNELDASGGGNDVPVITGYMANDGLLFSSPLKSSEDYERRLTAMYGSFAADFKRLYPAASMDEMQKSIQDSTRDRERVSMFLWAEARVERYRSPVYTYFFTHAIPWPQHPEYGAFHSGELPYFFDNLQILDRPWTPVDRQLAQTASGYLKAFASTGNPNGPALPKWPAVKPSKPETLDIGDKIQPIPLADKAKYDFWVKYFASPESPRAPLF